MRIRILDPAKDDLAEGYWFYESQEAGLGRHFLDHIFAEIDGLEHHAGIHPVYHPPFFQMFSDKFPFSIYYRVEDEVVLVDAVIDQRRDPEWIVERLN